MTEIRVEVQDAAVQEALRRAKERLTNTRPLMAGIAKILLGATERAFDEARDPESGAKWKSWSDATIKYRAKHGKDDGQILQFSQGGLASSITPFAGETFAELTTDKEYSAIHQFGGMAGRNRKVRIPARSYLGLGQEDKSDIIEAVENHLKNPAS